MKTHHQVGFRIPMSIASALLLITGASIPAYAEDYHNFGLTANGPTAWGVNRVVRTNSSGYVEVEGTVDIIASLPPLNAHRNSPSVYFGGVIGGQEFDAGLQFEQRAISPAPGEDPIAPGWFAFIKGGAGINNGFTSPRVWGTLPGASPGTPADNVPWRSVGTSMNSALRMEFTENGHISLYVGAMSGRFYHYPGDSGSSPRAANPQNTVAPHQPRPSAYFSAANRTTSNVKRVVAMTRPAPYNAEPDGATMRAVFSGGRVRRHNEASLVGTTGNYWQSGDVNQSATGYDSPGNTAINEQAWDKRFQRNGRWFLTPVVPPAGSDSRSRTIVEFPDLSVSNEAARTNSYGSWNATEGGNSRYTRETVRINLRSATGTSGEEVD